VGYQWPSGGWDITSRYFQYDFSGTDSLSDPDGYSDPLLVFIGEDATDYYDIYYATASLDYEITDWNVELGRNVALTDTWRARMFGGIQRTEIERGVVSWWTDDDTLPLEDSDDRTLVEHTLDFTGWGPRLGVTTEWDLNRSVKGGCMTLFGTAAYAPLWGDHEFSIRESDWEYVGLGADDGVPFRWQLDDHIVRADDSEGDGVVHTVEAVIGLRWAYEWSRAILNASVAYTYQGYYGLQHWGWVDDGSSNYQFISPLSDINVGVHGFILSAGVEF
jgi:hypothetical protein